MSDLAKLPAKGCALWLKRKGMFRECRPHDGTIRMVVEVLMFMFLPSTKKVNYTFVSK